MAKDQSTCEMMDVLSGVLCCLIAAATILLSMGVNLKVIQERLGHANVTITLGSYSHVTESMQQEATQTLNQTFKRA